MKLRYRFTLGSVLTTAFLAISLNILINIRHRNTSQDFHQISETLKELIEAVLSIYTVALILLALGAIFSFARQRRELGIAFAFSLVFSLLCGFSMATAFSGSDYLYLPAAALLGMIAGKLVNWPDGYGFFLAAFLTAILGVALMRMFMLFF